MATSSTFEEDEVPPLEDCSELLKQIKALGCHETTASSVAEEVPHHGNQESGLSVEARETQKCDQLSNGSDRKPENEQKLKTSSRSKKPQTFGGFQKGFLTKQSAHSSPVPKNPSSKPKNVSKEEEIPIIRAKDPTDSNVLKIPEVQDAMKTQPSLLQNTDWINDDLMEKLKDHPDLMKKLLDPRCSQALSNIQSNPQKVQEILKCDKDLQDVFEELSAVLGDHFTAVAEQNQSKVDGKTTQSAGISSTDEAQMAKILSDQAVLNALKDPWISKLVENLKKNPPEARRMLARMRPEFLPKIQKLVDAGILSFG